MIRHDGYKDAVGLAVKKGTETPLRLLEQEFVANPDDIWNLFYLEAASLPRAGKHSCPRCCASPNVKHLARDPLNRVTITPFAFILAADLA